ARLDRLDRFRVEVHLAPEEAMQLTRYGGPAHGEEADAIDEPPDESQGARLAGPQLQLKVESERERVPADAIEDREIDLRNAQRLGAVALGVEEPRQEPAAVAPAVALGGDERMDDREPPQRADLHLPERLPVGRATEERPQIGIDGEAAKEGHEARQRLVVHERDPPIRHREAESVAPPARLVAEGPVAERQPRDVAHPIVVIGFFIRHYGHVAELPPRRELFRPGPTEVTRLQPPVLCRGEDFRLGGDQPQRWSL